MVATQGFNRVSPVELVFAAGFGTQPTNFVPVEALDEAHNQDFIADHPLFAAAVIVRCGR
jgi:hypothetical protein